MSKVQFTPKTKKQHPCTFDEYFELNILKGKSFRDDCKNAVREWLTQKRKETKQLPEKVSYGGLWVLDELIDELGTVSNEEQTKGEV